jgi:hypothetical protein
MPSHPGSICCRTIWGMRGWKIAVLITGILLNASASQAQDHAQDQAQNPPARALDRKVAENCATEIVQFCPSVTGNEDTGRDAAICLKPYRSSLSLPCRHAVQAIFK